MEESQQTESVLSLMKSHPYFHDLPDPIFIEVSNFIAVKRYDTGDVVYAANEPVNEIGFVVAGRLKGLIVDADGKEKLLRFVEGGEAIGMISAAMIDPLPVTAIAVEPTTILMLDYETALELTSKHIILRRRWTQKLARKIRADILGDAPSQKTAVVTLFHQSPGTRDLITRLALHLQKRGERVAVMSDQTAIPGLGNIPFRCFIKNERLLSENEIYEQIASMGQLNRLLVDVNVESVNERAEELIGLSHHVLWILRPEDQVRSHRFLKDLVTKTNAFREKISLVWYLNEKHFSPLATDLQEVTSRSFKLTNSSNSPTINSMVGSGLDRISNFLRGIQVGLALGGGAARGMAHLGVLRTLERHGIVVDKIVGTSAGAMTGILYASGLDADYVADRFVEDLKPSWLFRRIPQGGYWYLLYKYRRGQFDPMLRTYLNDLTLDQLSIPCASVSVDLVSGRAVIRRSGDAVDAILESINLPLLSVPIVRNGQALVDGGYVNNVPANILASDGCNVVIAVDVMAKIESEFGGIRPDSHSNNLKSTNSVQTLLRTYAVQSHHLSAIGVKPADVHIEPDASQYSLAAFTEAKEIADLGERETIPMIPRIKALISRLEKPQITAGQ